MLLRIFALVLGASILAITAPARAQSRVQIVPGVPAVAVVHRSTPGVLKNGGGSAVQCQEELPDGSWRMVLDTYSEAPCELGFGNGVFIRIWQGEAVTTDEEGSFAHGTIARVYTSGLSYHLLGDQRHLIEPNATVELVIENHLTHILSKEGRTSVVACGAAEDSACVRRGFTLLEGDLISLMREGQVYAWENAEGDDLTLEDTGGCSVGNGSRPSLWMILFIGTLMWLRRRRINYDS